MPLATFDIPEGKWAPDSVALKAKPFNTDEYANVLVKLCEPKLNKKMRIQARAFAKNYTWENVAKNFEIFIYDILKKQR